ncbi:phage holin family protein [Nocardioides sp. Kera G14]|uniref:phage holin family protein n=1 Tax=Nocardioides sp. Kera G14 TaxID=2884264 RepID=UPI001D128D9D|nr:phage holin family protein [Nocardioides sp. Kera G14]UDY23422.1 phage holin family protein [Nocardioides sp. Kera G14]
MPAPPGSSDERSLGEIFSDVANDLSTLIKQEMDLAKTEMKEEAKKAGKGAGLLGGAGLAGYMVLLFVSLTAVFALDEGMPLWLAALIVTVIWGVIAAVLAVTGRSALKRSNPQLPQTQQTLKEDAAWARAQKN